jgi:hypothetical protein
MDNDEITMWLVIAVAVGVICIWTQVVFNHALRILG